MVGYLSITFYYIKSMMPKLINNIGNSLQDHHNKHDLTTVRVVKFDISVFKASFLFLIKFARTVECF